MDITHFNKELATRISTAKGYEKNGDIKSAIKTWLEISEMAISLSKNPKLDASFRNMLMNRIKGIFEHVKSLKLGQLEKEVYPANITHPIKKIQGYTESENNYIEIDDFQEPENKEITTSISKVNKNQNIIEDSDLKNLPKGFKELETSKDFEIITPHDKDFVKKQLDKALDGDHFETKKQEGQVDTSKTQKRFNFDQPEESKNKICFACGYDKNLIKDKICRNCGTNLE